MTDWEEHRRDETAAATLLGDSHVTICHAVTASHANALNCLDVGHLLQFMDIAACMAAERHCKTNCVTLSMDDLHFDHDVPLGAQIRLDAQINRVCHCQPSRRP